MWWYRSSLIKLHLSYKIFDSCDHFTFSLHTVSSQNFRSLSCSGIRVKKINNQDHVGKNLSKDSLEVNVGISRKKLSLTKKIILLLKTFLDLAPYERQSV